MKVVYRIVGAASLLFIIGVSLSPWEFYSAKLSIALWSFVVITISLEFILFTKNNDKRLIRGLFSGVLLTLFWIFSYKNNTLFSNQFLRFRSEQYSDHNHLIEIDNSLFGRKNKSIETYTLSRFAFNKTLLMKMESITVGNNVKGCIITFPASKIRFDRCTRKIVS